MRLPLRLPAALLAAALLLAGCGNDAGAADEPSEAPTSEAPSGDALSDGAHFGFLTAVDAAAGTIGFDQAVWVNSDDEPNGYRIDDPEPEVVTLPLADGVSIEVLMSTGDPSTATDVDAAGLQEWIEGPAAGQAVAFDLEIADGEVTELRFVYRP